jgi:peptide deformylase
MVLKIVQVGEQVLRQVGRELSVEEIRSDKIQNLISMMHDTLRDAPGVGLAAPQIGESLQLAIVEDLPEYSRNLTPEQMEERERTPVPFHVIVNPKLTGIGEPDVEFFEGCLSLNGFTAMVPRYRRVRVECFDELGHPKVIEASGWYARILQHEIDHLNGRIYIDRMYSRTFMSIDNATRHWKDVPTEEVKHRLQITTRDVK